MTGRRPIAALFTALVLWLTAVSSVRGAMPTQSRWLDVDGAGVATLSIAVPRAAVPSLRPDSRSLTPPIDLGCLPTAWLATDVVRAADRDDIPLARARSAQGTARTYDATAPPRSTR